MSARRTIAASVIALTLTTVSGVALANEPAPPSSAAAVAPAAPPAASSAPAAPVAATPLQTRPSRPLTLATANEHTPLGYKVLAGAGIVAAAILWMRNKKRSHKAARAKSRIDVLARTSVGVRNELLVVDVEGTRLLIGMTPSSIQTLSVLEIPADATETAADAEAEEAVAAPPARRQAAKEIVSTRAPAEELDQRVRSLLGNRGPKTRPSVEMPAVRPSTNTSGGYRQVQARASKQMAAVRPSTQMAAVRPSLQMARVAGQAKGLMLAMDDEGDA